MNTISVLRAPVQSFDVRRLRGFYTPRLSYMLCGACGAMRPLKGDRLGSRYVTVSAFEEIVLPDDYDRFQPLLNYHSAS
jgi:hypothetical protein